MTILHERFNRDNLKAVSVLIFKWAVEHKYTLLLFLLAFFVYAWISIVRHILFQSHAFDLAIFAQSSWLVSTFQEPFSTVRLIFQPADHFAPTYLLLSLPYAIFDSPIYLLVLQLGSALLGGIPVYLITKDVLKSRVAANFLLIAYFLQVGLISAIIFDFSTTALSVGFIAWALYFVHTKKLLPYIAFMLLAMGCKEDVSLLFAVFSLYFVITRQWKWFITTLLISMTWYLAVMYYILPILFDQPHQYSQITNPLTGWAAKENTVKEVFRQNLGFALANPIGILFAGANLGMRFLLGSPNYWTNEWHYGANMAAPLIISTALGIKFFVSKVNLDPKSSYIYISLAIAATTIATTGVLSGVVRPIGVSRTVINEGLSLIPLNASVSAQDSLTPHLTSRKEIYHFPRVHRYCEENTLEACGKVEYIALSKNVGSWPLTHDEIIDYIAKYKSSPDYEVLKELEGIIVFKLKN